MFDLKTIVHMNKPKQVARSRAIALAMNKGDTQKSRCPKDPCDHTRKTPPVCGHGKCFDRWNRAVSVIVLCVSLLLVGCQKRAQSKEKTSNEHFKIELLFEHDGVKVYRFGDAGRSVYYTDARGQTAWIESCGKNCSRSVTVETVK